MAACGPWRAGHHGFSHKPRFFSALRGPLFKLLPPCWPLPVKIEAAARHVFWQFLLKWEEWGASLLLCRFEFYIIVRSNIHTTTYYRRYTSTNTDKVKRKTDCKLCNPSSLFCDLVIRDRKISCIYILKYIFLIQTFLSFSFTEKCLLYRLNVQKWKYRLGILKMALRRTMKKPTNAQHVAWTHNPEVKGLMFYQMS